MKKQWKPAPSSPAPPQPNAATSINKKERNLIKGGIRRVFSRSDARRSILFASEVPYFDDDRPRVRRWGKCGACDNVEALYQLEVDHIDPVIPIKGSLDSMTWDEVVNRIFCHPSNLMVMCKPCHKAKTKKETKARAQARKHARETEGMDQMVGDPIAGTSVVSIKKQAKRTARRSPTSRRRCKR